MWRVLLPLVVLAIIDCSTIRRSIAERGARPLSSCAEAVTRVQDHAAAGDSGLSIQGCLTTSVSVERSAGIQLEVEGGQVVEREAGCVVTFTLHDGDQSRTYRWAVRKRDGEIPASNDLARAITAP